MNTTICTLTVGTVARESDTSPPTVRLYGNLGLIEYIKASDGTRLHGQDTPAQVREIKARRLKNRGGNRRRA